MGERTAVPSPDFMSVPSCDAAEDEVDERLKLAIDAEHTTSCGPGKGSARPALWSSPERCGTDPADSSRHIPLVRDVRVGIRAGHAP